ncbi:helix-turn-helix transcriptional regulator [Phocaeicola faecicola]|jgi:AraC-like DNA-binding protein/mannose-6-phosphate isomerase-like protein (cupin superfamily)|uniref:helix-turn-helix transcriptional regulator n=1 Tax=Phocaeicola faecicola TaxID=2739389 RepID=UPI0015B7708D|nr:AraC family transcriptional regulator [Phocaeicola faecicola]MDD6907528.1 AraC family transcriptional regulator [Bacteroidaceae bacterium]MDY4871758.1 AraC family transcriptional regulator [Phocaeicola faecicola]
MNHEQINYLGIIRESEVHEILVKKTGWEDIHITEHIHQKFQIIYTLSGTLHVYIGSTSYFVPEKHIAWIPAHTAHRLTSNNRQASLVIFYASLPLPLPSEAQSQFAIYPVNPLISENLKFLATFVPSISQLQHPDIYQYSISFFRMQASICPHTKRLFKNVVLSNDSRLPAILEYMTDHLQEELKIGDVAAQFGLSVRNLSRLFNASGIHFCNYLNRQRIIRAIELASDGEKNMKQVAYEVGFNIPTNFNRVFKQVTGMSPSEFLKK